MCLLERCMVRHTKRQVLGGQQVLQLPPKVEEDVPGETACLPACMHACDSAALAHSRAFLAAAHAICARAPPLPHPRAVVLSASEAAVYMEAHTRCAAVFVAARCCVRIGMSSFCPGASDGTPAPVGVAKTPCTCPCGLLIVVCGEPVI